MKKLILILTLICITLSACAGQKTSPAVFPSITPEPDLTATSTSTITLPTQPPSAPTITPFPLYQNIPTITPFPPYQNKQVVFNYFIVGNQADDDPFFAPESCCTITRLVLYADGQMIVAGETGTYKQKVLSSDEMKQFLAKLETLGFYSLESNQKHDLTDKLYDYGNNYQESSDGLKYCILVNAGKSRNLCVRGPDEIQFLIPMMKNILKYLDEYKPAGLTPYYPDRILLTIQANIDPAIDNPPAIPWNEYFPSLDTSIVGRFISDTSNRVIFIDGDMAKEIYLFLKGDHTNVVSQNSKEYIVYFRVLLPHEKIVNPYH